jgi:hypothetical protein
LPATRRSFAATDGARKRNLTKISRDEDNEIRCASSGNGDPRIAVL